MVWVETKVNCILANPMPSVTRVCGYVPVAALPINQSRINDSMWRRASEPNRQRFCLPEAELSAKLSSRTGWVPRLEKRTSTIRSRTVRGGGRLEEKTTQVWSLTDCFLSAQSPHSLSPAKEMRMFLQDTQCGSKARGSPRSTDKRSVPRGRRAFLDLNLNRSEGGGEYLVAVLAHSLLHPRN